MRGWQKSRRKRCPAVPPKLHRQANAPDHSWEDEEKKNESRKLKEMKGRRERKRKEEAGGLLPVAYIPLVMPALAFNWVLALSVMAILQTWHKFGNMTAEGLSHAIWMRTQHFVWGFLWDLLWMNVACARSELACRCKPDLTESVCVYVCVCVCFFLINTCLCIKRWVISICLSGCVCRRTACMCSPVCLEHTCMSVRVCVSLCEPVRDRQRQRGLER